MLFVILSILTLIEAYLFNAYLTLYNELFFILSLLYITFENIYILFHFIDAHKTIKSKKLETHSYNKILESFQYLTYCLSTLLILISAHFYPNEYTRFISFFTIGLIGKCISIHFFKNLNLKKMYSMIKKN